jgi:hypothetical protein
VANIPASFFLGRRGAYVVQAEARMIADRYKYGHWTDRAVVLPAILRAVWHCTLLLEP